MKPHVRKRKNKGTGSIEDVRLRGSFLQVHFIPLLLEFAGNEMTPLPLACTLPIRVLPRANGTRGTLKSFVS